MWTSTKKKSKEDVWIWRSCLLWRQTDDFRLIRCFKALWWVQPFLFQECEDGLTRLFLWAELTWMLTPKLSLHSEYIHSSTLKGWVPLSTFNQTGSYTASLRLLPSYNCVHCFAALTLQLVHTTNKHCLAANRQLWWIFSTYFMVSVVVHLMDMNDTCILRLLKYITPQPCGSH